MKQVPNKIRDQGRRLGMEVAVVRLTIGTFSNSYSLWSDGNGGVREGLDRERRCSRQIQTFRQPPSRCDYTRQPLLSTVFSKLF